MLAELTTKADFVTSLLLSVLILAGTETSAAAVFLTVMGLAGAGSSSPSSAESIFREVDDVFLQVQARIWLGEVLNTRLDEQMNISDLLADGELLFEVSKVVGKMLSARFGDMRHGKVYRYNAAASKMINGRYTPYSNVDSFLMVSCQCLLDM